MKIGKLSLAVSLSVVGLSSVAAAPTTPWPTDPGSHIRVFDSTAGSRGVRIHLPAGFDRDDGKIRPLVVALHGGLGNGRDFETSTGYSLKADAKNFIVAYPNGSGSPRTWNASVHCCGPANTAGVDDVGFLRELVVSLRDSYGINASKVFAVGFSNGAVMAWRLACDAADLFSAIGTVAGDSTMLHSPTAADPYGSACDLGGRTVRIVNIHGDADNHMPYMGGPSPAGVENYDRQPVEDPNPNLYGGQTDISMWTGLNGCAFQPIAPTETTLDYEKKVFCGASGLQIVNYKVLGGEHQWYPGSSSAISSTDITWDFFENGSPVPPLFDDGFESGDFATGGWVTTGSPTVAASAAFSGSMGAILRGTASITRHVSTVGYTGVRVEYHRHTANMDAGENLRVQWSTNGIAWTTIETTNANGWNTVPISVVLPAAAAGQPGFRIRFRTNANAIVENARIDDVTVLAN